MTYQTNCSQNLFQFLEATDDRTLDFKLHRLNNIQNQPTVKVWLKKNVKLKCK